MTDRKDQDRAEQLAETFFDTWENEGQRERVVDRIAHMRANGAADHVIINAAKSVRDRSNPVSLFMEVTSTRARWQAAAMAGSQIYPAPGIAPPKEELPEEEKPRSLPTMCRVHGIKLYVGRHDEVPTRCSRCESEGDFSGRANRPRARY
ncbi:hypothetical protein ACFW3Z_25585 [Nocardiopsis alba]|uniref:hypothetical protein n=1 Tax=Nocardiopsis alba TaxID=53437 RepID=UPI00366ECC65